MVRRIGIFDSRHSAVPLGNNIFKFTLADTFTTSAAVYSSTGEHLRTLWDSVDYGAGLHVFEWDELDKYGDPITGVYGTDFVISIGKHQMVANWLGGKIGNTSTELTGDKKLRSFTPMTSGVLAGGKLFVATGYAEGIASAKRIELSAKGEKYDINFDAEGKATGFALAYNCTDGNVVYWSGHDPFGANNSGIIGSYVHDDSTVDFGATFTDSYQCTYGPLYNSVIGLNTGGTSYYITGLAVNDTHLFVARGGVDTLEIYDKFTGELLSTLSAGNYVGIKSISITGDKLIAIVGSPYKVKSFTISGTTLTLITSPVTEFPSTVEPLNLNTTKKEQYYLQNVDEAITGYKKLDTWSPVGTQDHPTVTISLGSTPTLVQSFIINTSSFLTAIPASTWTFSTWVNRNAAVIQLIHKVYKRDTLGVETLLFEVTSSGISNFTPSIIQSTTTHTPGALAIDSTDILIYKVYIVKGGGGVYTGGIYYDGATYLSNFSIVPIDTYVYICDGGSSQQIKQYDLDKTLINTRGQLGGALTNGPAVANDKLYLNDSLTELYNMSEGVRTFIVPTLDESYWCMDIGNNRLQHYAADFTFIERIAWLPHSYSCQINKTDATMIFNEYCEFYVPLGQPENWELRYNYRPYLTASYYQNFIVNVFMHVATLSNGETYAFVKRVSDNRWEQLRLSHTLGIVYGAGFTSDPYDSIGTDIAGNIYKLNCSGNPGDTVSWQKATLTGFTSLVAQYSAFAAYASAPVIPANGVDTDPSFGTGESFVPIMDDGTLVLYCTGYVNKGYHVGIVEQGASIYKSKVMPSTFRDATLDVFGAPMHYQGPYPSPECIFDIGNNVEYAGIQAFTIDSFTLAGYRGEFWQNTQVNKGHLIHKNGMQLLTLGVTAEEARALTNTEQAAYAMAGNIFAGGISKIGNSLVYVHNDESYHSGVHYWEIDGLNTFSVINATLGGTPATYAWTDLLGSLPARQQVVVTGGNIVKNPNTNYFTNNDNYFATYSGLKEYTSKLGVWLRFRSNVGVSATLDFTFAPAVTSEFTVKGEIMFTPNSWTTDEGVYLEILDSADKVIADFCMQTSLTFPNPNTVKANENDLLVCTREESSFYDRFFNEFQIRVHSGGCDFAFGGQTLTNLALKDVTANKLEPRKVRIHCKGATFNYDQHLALRTLEYKTI